MKSKLLEFIQSIKATLADMKNRANEQIKNLPPIEQHEASNMILGIQSELAWQVRRAEEIANSEVIAKADEIFAALQTEVVNEAIAAGAVIAKDNHESLIEAARQGGILAGKQEAQEAFIAQRQQEQTIATRRAEVDAVLGADHGVTISDETLTGEGYDSFLASLKDAVTAATENGFTRESAPKGFSHIIAAAFQGKDAVNTIIASLLEVRGPAAAGAGNAGAAQPFVAGAKPDPGKSTGFVVKKPF